MNIVELYSLTSGQKIKKKNVLEKFYPLNIDKYIVFQPFSKPSKCFNYWQDVIDILHPILKEAGISILQIGLNSEPSIQGCVDLRGKTNINQCAYLISKAELVLSSDSFSSHLAGLYNKNIVVLISNNYSQCVSPFFGDKSKQIILEPDRIKRKPSFSLDEGVNKQINEIKIEAIARAVCRLLNLTFDFPYETIYTGNSYTNQILESVPSSVTNVANMRIDNLIVRMDYEFSENVLEHQMQHCPVTIVTNKPINLELLKTYKPRIKQLFYIIDENYNLDFAIGIQKLSIPLSMTTNLNEEELNSFKLEFLDVGLIQRKITKTKEEIIKNLPVEKLYYKSSKHTLYNGKLFSSKAAWLKNDSIPQLNQIQSIIDTEEFWKESEYHLYLKEKI